MLLHIISEMQQDHEIQFDMPLSHIEMGFGEITIDTLDSIEDTKGNFGDQGHLVITNLRIIWYSVVFPRINLSIGYSTIIDITTQNINTSQRGFHGVLHLLTIYRNCRYEFVFTSLKNRNIRHCTSAIGVYRAYVSTKLYREVKLRGGFIQNQVLSLLPDEVVKSTTCGVWNLSTAQGNIGTFTVTNIRIVWFADMNDQFNVSIPYLAIDNVSLKPSKSGPTLIIVSKELQSRYILGFCVDPVNKLNILLKEVSSLMAAYNKRPILGIKYVSDAKDPPIQNKLRVSRSNEQNSNEYISSPLDLYFTNFGQEKSKKPVFDSFMGLAVEKSSKHCVPSKAWTLIINI